jgi:hypothetical protein
VVVSSAVVLGVGVVVSAGVVVLVVVSTGVVVVVVGAGVVLVVGAAVVVVVGAAVVVVVGAGVVLVVGASTYTACDDAATTTTSMLGSIPDCALTESITALASSVPDELFCRSVILTVT